MSLWQSPDSVRLVGGLFTLLSLIGCSGGGNAPSTVPVTGIVSLDGKPLAHATVSFIPTEPGGATAGGITNDEGQYVLSQGPYAGAQIGSYKVVIEHWVQRDGKPVPEDIRGDLEQLKTAGAAKLSIPPKYADPAKTDLTAEVQADASSNTIDFQLASK